MSMEEDGFLSKTIFQEIEEFNEIHKEAFNLAFELNRVAHSLKYKIKVTNDQNSRIYLFGLYLRALDLYSSVINLVKIGNYKDSAILLRTLFEVIVYLKQTIIQDDFLETAMQDYLFEKQKMVNSIKSCKDIDFKNSFSEKTLEDVQKDIDEQFDKENHQKLNLADLVKNPKINLEKEYILIFRIYSLETHSNYRSIHDYLDFDENKVVKSFAPQHPYPLGKQCLTSSMLVLGIAIEEMSTFFDCPIENLDSLKKRIGIAFDELNLK